jgi:hypothetical protein
MVAVGNPPLNPWTAGGFSSALPLSHVVAERWGDPPQIHQVHLLPQCRHRSFHLPRLARLLAVDAAVCGHEIRNLFLRPREMPAPCSHLQPTDSAQPLHFAPTAHCESLEQSHDIQRGQNLGLPLDRRSVALRSHVTAAPCCDSLSRLNQLPHLRSPYHTPNVYPEVCKSETL